MKKVLIPLSILLLGACAKESSLTPESELGGRVSITARSSSGLTEWADNSALVLKDLTNGTETTYSCSSSVWSSEIPLELSSSAVDIFGYISKYGDVSVSGISTDGVTLPQNDGVVDQTSDLTPFDYQYYYGEGLDMDDINDGAIDIDLEYALAKLTIKVLGNDVTAATVSSTPSIIPFADGAWSDATGSVNTKAYETTAGELYTAYVSPCTWSSPSIILTVDGAEVTATRSSAMTLVASNEYTISISLKSDGTATFADNFTVEEWTTGDDFTDLTAPLDTWDGSIADGFAGGAGVSTDPFIIKTGAQLAYISGSCSTNDNYHDIYFKLEADIDLDKRPFTQITNFNGNIDGDGHTIYNLYMAGAACALIGTYGGTHTIENLTLDSPVLEPTGNNTAVIVGYSSSASTIKNVNIVDGKISGFGSNVGSIFGVAANASLKITNCHVSNFTIDSATSLFGGLIGKSTNATIEASSFNGSISRPSANGGFVGGLVGDGSGGVTIIGCYSSGTISNNTTAGCLGYNISGIVTSSYSTMTITNGTVSIGGISGVVTTTPTVTNSYYTDSSLYDIAGSGTSYYIADLSSVVEAMNNQLSDWEYVASSDGLFPYVIKAKTAE